MLEKIQYLSILIEVIVAALGIMIFFDKKKKYGIWIFTTFAIYVFYDLVNMVGSEINRDVLYLLFFIATASILCSVWMIYRQSSKKWGFSNKTIFKLKIVYTKRKSN